MGYEIYEHVIGQVDYPFFFKRKFSIISVVILTLAYILNMFFVDFNMPDTFVAWFLVTELHVWMIMTRYMADEKNGKAIRNYAVAAMWQDTQARIENLGVSNIVIVLLIYYFIHTHTHRMSHFK